MTGQQIIDEVRRELLEFGAQLFWTDAELLTHLNNAESDMANKTRALENIAFTTLVQGQIDYPLPSDWLGARLIMQNLPSSDSPARPDWKRIYPSNLEKVAQEDRNFIDTSVPTQGRPRIYWIWGNTLYLYPAPDIYNNGTQMFLYYKCKSTPLTSLSDSINIDDSLHEGLVEYILWKAWRKEQEYDLANEHRDAYVAYVNEARRWLKRKSMDQRWKIDIESNLPINQNTPGQNPLSPS